MLAHYGVEQPAETIDGDKYMNTKEALYSLKSERSGKCFEAAYLSIQKELCTRS